MPARVIGTGAYGWLAFVGFTALVTCLVTNNTPDDLRQARWWLAEAAGTGLRVGLDLLGVTAPERM